MAKFQTLNPRPAIYFRGNLDFTTAVWACVNMGHHTRLIEHKEVDALPLENPRSRILATSNDLGALTQWATLSTSLSAPTPYDPNPHTKADQPRHRFRSPSTPTTTTLGAALNAALLKAAS